MSDAITRKEAYLKSIGDGTSSALKPITREEQYLAYIAGESNSFPTTPITREEAFLDKIAKSGVSGGSSINVQPLTATANGTYDAPEGQAYDPVTVDVKPITEPITITENGVYPVPKGGPLDYGKEVKFKEVITEEDWQAYMSSATGEDWGFGSVDYEVISAKPTVCNLNAYHDGPRVLFYYPNNRDFSAGAYVYQSDAEAFNIITETEQFTEGNGWYQLIDNGNAVTRCSAPSVVIPESATLAADLETTAILFDIETRNLDGWGDITVNVAGGGDDIAKALIERSISGNYTFNCETVGMYAFYKCQNLENITILNATHIHDYAFSQSGIKSINAPNITGCGACVFQNCNSLKEGSFNELLTTGQSMFSGCSELTKVSAPKLTKINPYAFQNCVKFHGEFPNVTSVDMYAFQSAGQTSITVKEFPKLTTVGAAGFQYAYFVELVDTPIVTTISSSAFRNCRTLKTIKLPNIQKFADDGASYCDILETVDTGATDIRYFAFRYSYSFKTLILRSNTLCTLNKTDAFTSCYHFHGTVNETYNPNGDKDGYIYVPKALIEDYKVATNWSAFADQFRAIEDYPEITGG